MVSDTEDTGVNTLPNVLGPQVTRVITQGWAMTQVNVMGREVTFIDTLWVHCEEFPVKGQPREGVMSVSRGLFCRKPDPSRQKWLHLSQMPSPLSLFVVSET